MYTKLAFFLAQVILTSYVLQRIVSGYTQLIISDNEGHFTYVGMP